MFSQRIVNVDFYNAPPIRNIDVIFSEFRGNEVKRVPVLRIFGATSNGEKTCAHVHRVFPYFYVRNDSSMENFEDRLAVALDQAINVSLGNKDWKSVQHVFKIVKVAGKSLYGYHGSNGNFLKIFFYDPLMIKKAAELLQEGRILSTKFHPYESHIPYELQFLIDFNLYGMNLIHYSSVKFRGARGNSEKLISPLSSSSSLTAVTAGGGQNIWDVDLPHSLDKMSRCELEVDVLGSDILVASSHAGLHSSNPRFDEIQRRTQVEGADWSPIRISESQSRAFDNKSYDIEEMHLKTLWDNVAKNDEQINETSSSSTIPSSQLYHHTAPNLTFVDEVRLPSTLVSSGKGDDERLYLLDELVNEKEQEEAEEIGSSLGSQVVDFSDPHNTVNDENENLEEFWNESFLCKTIIDDLLKKADDLNVEGETSTASNDIDKVNIAQVDGQDDDSSSNSDSAVSTPPMNDSKDTMEISQLRLRWSAAAKSVHLATLPTKSPLAKPGAPVLRLSKDKKPKVTGNITTNTLPCTPSKTSINPSTAVRASSRLSLRKKEPSGIQTKKKIEGTRRSPKKLKVVNDSSKNVLRRSSRVSVVASAKKSEDLSTTNKKTVKVHMKKPNFEKEAIGSVKELIPSQVEESSERLNNSSVDLVQILLKNIREVTRPEPAIRRKRRSKKNVVTQKKSLPVPQLVSINQVNDICNQTNDTKPNIENISTGIAVSINENIKEEPQEPLVNRAFAFDCDTTNIFFKSELLDIKLSSLFPHLRQSNVCSESSGISNIDTELSEDYPGPSAEPLSFDNNSSHDNYNSVPDMSVNEIHSDNKDSNDNTTFVSQSTSTDKTRTTDSSCQTEWMDLTIEGPLCRCLSEPEKTFEDQGVDALDSIKKDNEKSQIEMGDTNAGMIGNGERLVTRTPQRSDASGSTSSAHSSPSSSKQRLGASSKSGVILQNSASPKVRSGARISHNSLLYAKYVNANTPSCSKSNRYYILGSHSPTNLPSSSKTRLLTKTPITPPSSIRYGTVPMTRFISKFQNRQSRLKDRKCNRVRTRREKILQAYRLAPATCEHEYEPLKEAPSYQALEKWSSMKGKGEADSIDNAGAIIPSKPEELVAHEAEAENSQDSSSDEEIVPDVRRFGGGNASDDDGEDIDTCLSSGRLSSLLTTPSQNNQGNSSQSSFNVSVQRSILKGMFGPARRISEKLKRKIRWADEEPAAKSQKSEIRKESVIHLGSTKDSPPSLSCLGNASEMDGPSPKNMFGFENDISNLQNAKALHQNQYLTTMSVEIHCDVRGDLVPDPAVDTIRAIFIYISNDVPEGHKKPKELFLYLSVGEKESHSENVDQHCQYFLDEISMLNGFVIIVREWDPDLLVGYEIQRVSWGYIIERGFTLGKNMLEELSRVILPKTFRKPNQDLKNKDSWNEKISGRIVFNLWRLLRHEIEVHSYTFESTSYHVLHRRTHLFSYALLASYWNIPKQRQKVVSYYYERTKGTIEIMENLDLVNRTSELARLFGIQFYEVISRGSQFRVESMMLRIAKPKNFILASPSISQRAKMRAPEFLPLILEPYTNYYTDPVAVLHFQSLYPSVIIGYNYCYTTCLGRVEHLGKSDSFDFGCLEQSVSPSELKLLKDHIHVSPAGVAFVDSSIRKGVLPEMLKQILETRQMVKGAMKRWKDEDAALLKVLDSRQLGLKLLANVTYGYTTANFSGKMPCVEIADSVVSKGRETLQRAIDLVKDNYERWKADVVYGDTDSLFVRFPGITRQEAFVLAQQIVDEVTQANPKPVTLKLEKIYQPFILQSEKRYVGYAYKTPDQEKPIYDAKGIETVSRDGCPAVKKIMEKTLHTLFTTNNLTRVQNYVESQFRKIFNGRVSIQEFTFAREYRGRQGYNPGEIVPVLEIAKKAIQRDPRAEPLQNQRVPYVIVYGNSKLPLIQLVQTPLDFVKNSNLRLNAHYYIEKVLIPALNRCLIEAKMDSWNWYTNLARKYLRSNFDRKDGGRETTLDHFFQSMNCLRCDGNTYSNNELCDACRSDGFQTTMYLVNKSYDFSRKLDVTQKICLECSGDVNKCISADCLVFHKRVRYERDDDLNNRIIRQLQELDRNYDF